MPHPQVFTHPAAAFATASPLANWQDERLFERAAQLEEQDLDACVDAYFQSTMEAWRRLESVAGDPSLGSDYRQACQSYQKSLASLIRTGRRYKRLDPRSHLTVFCGSQRHIVPIVHHGFAWRPGDFCEVLDAAGHSGEDFLHYYRAPGIGVALVGMRSAAQEETFFAPRQPFAVTAVLRSTRSTNTAPGGLSANSSAVLEFYNPYPFDRTALCGGTVALQRDLTGPWALIRKESPKRYLEGYLAPFDTDVQPKLMMAEPYQRGKIPVVLIHGLLSDPVTWMDAVNELRAQPDLDRQYQFWFFRYPTGRAILDSAADLREDLALVRTLCDPRCDDPAMERVVLIGHSMGGLVAKLQVTYSLDLLWGQVAKQPLEAIRTTPQVRDRLRRDFYFDPSPLVTRVVFMGTPHRGSTWSRRLVGRIGSSLVNLSGDVDAQYRELMSDNRDAFDPSLWRRWPTAVDLLEPSSPLLAGMGRLPFSPRVRLHSIIGTGGRALCGEAGDGVVSVDSAHHPGVCSELHVPVRHERLHHTSESLAELTRILREHASDSGN